MANCFGGGGGRFLGRGLWFGLGFRGFGLWFWMGL